MDSSDTVNFDQVDDHPQTPPSAEAPDRDLTGARAAALVEPRHSGARRTGAGAGRFPGRGAGAATQSVTVPGGPGADGTVTATTVTAGG
ncbi:hypothetical protein ACLQ28_10280 [Micromonospora sp. DT201]|uniref:hypothetical protein n=1 Tax=Micromonospora sp. DT201 TaxID=3393442 RepID=UPI003CEDD58F